MDIEGLSEAALEKLIGWGWLHTYDDIYSLDRYATEIISMEGFGEKSWSDLWDAIQRSRNTTFDRFLVAMDIPQVGSTASKALGKVFHGSLDEFEDAVCSFTQLPDFGDTLNNNIREWFQNEENWYLWGEMRKVLNVAPLEEVLVDVNAPKSPIAGMTIVATGKVEPYTRDQINDFIVSKGGIAGSSVTKKTDCLVCGENAREQAAKGAGSRKGNYDSG